jgi:hypothetical protein
MQVLLKLAREGSPSSFMNIFLNLNLFRATQIQQQYFQELRTFDELDDDDNPAIGEALYLARSKKGNESVGAVIELHKSLRELTSKYGWAPCFSEAVVAIDLGMSSSLAAFGEKHLD